MKLTQNEQGFTYATKDNISFNEVTSNNINTKSIIVGDTVTINNNGIDAGGTKITNIAAGTDPTDAANVGQLQASSQGLYRAIDEVNDNAKTGIAGAYVATALGQVSDPGKSSIGAGVGTFRGEAALSVGLSTRSDNGKWLVRGLIGVDTQEQVGAGASVNYQW